MNKDVTNAINIDDLKRLALRRLPRIVYDYIEGGAEDETTVSANREALRAICFVPRILAGGSVNTETELFGRTYSAPLLIAPTGLNGLSWRDGDLALARAAEAAGLGFCLSTASSCALEEITPRVSSRRWFQLYPWGEPSFSRRLIDRAASAGFDGLIVTVDSLVPGKRERDLRNGFAHNIRWSARVLLDGLMHPRWLGAVWLRGGAPRLENLADFLPSNATARQMADFSRMQRNPSFAWRDLAHIREAWKGPLLVKGILSPADAVRAIEQGVDGIVVSNHGGRQLDCALPTAHALADIAGAVGTKTTLLVDGGFERGADIAKALALGAKAVLVGRSALYGLAAGGQRGGERALSILTDELRRTMRLTGCTTVGELATLELRRKAFW
jgi:(S)-mandelate dehydrogenase